VRRQKYEAAVAFLKLIAAGEAVLDDSGDAVSSGDQVLVGSEFTSATRVFTRDSQDW
jgi:phage gp36-like protein